jgi:thiol:disulfide interchange protein DsbC
MRQHQRIKTAAMAVFMAIAMLFAGHSSARELYGIDDMADLPIAGIKAIQSNGEIMFISENGRFVIKGELYDMWYKTRHTDMAAMRELTDRLQIERMDIDFNELNAVTVGSGSKEVVAFIDPRCGYCHGLVQDAYSLVDEYTFRFVFISLLGKESADLNRYVSCAKERDAIMPAFLTDSLEELEQRKSCDSDRLIQSAATAKVLGIKGVPYIVSPSGRQHYMRPANLRAWLAQR